jgi:SNF2 family DNA or RNA helicase
MPKLTRADDELRLSLSGAADFNAALDRVRSIPGRRFDPDTKLWCFPNDPAVAERIMFTIKPSVDAALLRWIQETRAERDAELTTKLPAGGELFIPWRDALFEFQRDAVYFMAHHPKIILADDMGLGKTLQALSATAEFLIRNDTIDTTLPRLVVCPNSAKGVWAREVLKWLGANEPIELVDALTPKKREAQIEKGIKTGAWIVVNYEQIRTVKNIEPVVVNHRDGTVTEREKVTYALKQPLFTDTKWLAVIADEAHRIKNRKASQTLGMWMLEAPVMLALTGTPLQNNPAELWALLRWLYPEQYGRSTPGKPRTAYWSFHDQYTESYEGYKGSKVVVGVKNPDALRFELKDRLIRRTKQDELDLPEKIREVIPVKLGKKQRAIYSQAETAFWLEIEQTITAGEAADADDKVKKAAKEAKRFAEDVLSGTKTLYEIGNGATRTVRMRQVCSTPALLGGEDDSAKLDACVEKITDNAHKQHVVFTEFVETANILVERLRKFWLSAEAYTGLVTSTQVRAQYEDRFQNGEIDVLVGTIPAMGESLTLTAADTGHFIERSWVPSKNEQAEDRLWRTGQKNAVTILIYEAEDTVDTDKVKPTNALKENIVGSVIKRNKIKEVEAA